MHNWYSSLLVLKTEIVISNIYKINDNKGNTISEQDYTKNIVGQ